MTIAPSPGNTPLFSVSSHFSSFCGTCSKAHINSGSYQGADDFNLTTGRHQLGFGANFFYRNLDFQVSTQQNPEFDFSGINTGDPLADLFIGLPNQFIQGNLTKMNEVQFYAGLYANDHIRINSKLALTLGIRWEPYFPAHDTTGRATHFDMSAFLAGKRSTVFPNGPPGILFPGDPGMTDSGTHRHLANFAPRIGLVWDPTGTGRTSIRTAYGIMYDLPALQIFDRFGFGPPFASTVTIPNPAGGLGDPFAGYPGGNPFPQPIPPTHNAAFVTGGQYIDLPFYIKPPYTQQWNLSIQRQVGEDWLFTANYLGNKSTHRWTNSSPNYAVYIPGNCGSSACSTVANTNQRRILALADPVGGALFSTLTRIDDGANASYNGLLLSANHRLSRNFSALVNYTWSHCISDGDVSSEVSGGSYQDPNNRRGDRGNCVVDVRHIFNASVVALSPRFANGVAQRLLGSWELSGIITKRSGFWFNAVSSNDNSLSGVGSDRPNVVADSHVGNPSLNQWFNTAAFVANTRGAFGNSGRNNLEGPGAFTLDAALMRSFRVIERQTLVARVEAFNLLNHPVFNNPRNSITDANFGKILGAGDPRILQFALKYVF